MSAGIKKPTVILSSALGCSRLLRSEYSTSVFRFQSARRTSATQLVGRPEPWLQAAACWTDERLASSPVLILSAHADKSQSAAGRESVLSF
jgi:hypothetical protein